MFTSIHDPLAGDPLSSTSLIQQNAGELQDPGIRCQILKDESAGWKVSRDQQLVPTTNQGRVGHAGPIRSQQVIRPAPGDYEGPGNKIARHSEFKTKWISPPPLTRSKKPIELSNRGVLSGGPDSKAVTGKKY